MKQIVQIGIYTFAFFIFFLLALILGIIKKNRTLKLTSILLFFIFLGFAILTGYKLTTKSYNRLTQSFRPRTGDEIYDALFDKRKTACVKVLNYQDQIIPKIDYAIWLHFETCPNELKRILSRHEFSNAKSATNSWANVDIPYGETISWFNPKSLGDTILVYEYSANNSKSIQTLWVSVDSTNVFCRDIFD